MEPAGCGPPGPPALAPAPQALPRLAPLGGGGGALAEVYEPAEDTFLFVDTLHADRAALNARRPVLCVEVGGGSGCVTAALGQVLEQPAAFLMTDINPLAAAACLGTAHANGLRWADAVNCDLVGALSSRLAGRVDVLLFNPPYVVTPSEEIESSMIARAWAGGARGREVLDRLLPTLPALLAPGGFVYLIAIEENMPDEICSTLLRGGFASAGVLSRRRALNERLMIIKAVR